MVSTLASSIICSVLGSQRLTNSYVDFKNSDKVDFDVPFHFPLKRSALFIGRHAAMNELHRNAFSNNSERERMTKTITVIGTGGIGKSQLVVEFINVYREKFQSVLWINCASKESILNDFEAAALEIKAHAKTNKRSPKWITDFESAENKESKRKTPAVQLVQTWLSQANNSRWLIVFDGLDTPDEIDVDEYLPESHAGHVIITSRNRNADTYATDGHILRLELLSTENAASLLLRKAGIAKSLEEVSNGTL
jgi:hypothetical protein